MRERSPHGGARLRALLLATLLLASVPRALHAQDDGALRRESELAARALLCDCGCSPQSIHDCACGRASELRDAIAADVRSGKSGRQVIDAYVAQHGPKIRVAPAATGFNLLAWLGPGIALLTGLAATVLLIRRWRGSSPSGSPAAPPLVAADDPYLARLERELRETR